MAAFYFAAIRAGILRRLSASRRSFRIFRALPVGGITATFDPGGYPNGEESDSKSDAPQGVAGSSPVPSAFLSDNPPIIALAWRTTNRPHFAPKIAWKLNGTTAPRQFSSESPSSE